MSNRRLPSLTKDKWSEDKLNPRIIMLEVYKNEISDENSPFLFLILEKKEIKSSFEIYGLDTLTITYRVLNIHESQASGWFGASYDKNRNEFSIISDDYSSGALFLDPKQIRGYKIGTYIMSQIIMWAKHNYPDAKLKTIFLFENQADPENKERRNRFYEQFGIEFNYENEEKKSGTSKGDILINQLNSVESWTKNIKEVTVPDYFINNLKNIDNQKQKILDLTRANEWLRQDNEYYWNENIFQFIWRKLKPQIVYWALVLLIVTCLVNTFWGS